MLFPSTIIIPSVVKIENPIRFGNSELVIKCTGDLKSLEGKVRSLCHDAGENVVQRGVKRTRAFLENKELVKTRQIIYHNVSISVKSRTTIYVHCSNANWNSRSRL
jgi:hypothetical protein